MDLRVPIGVFFLILGALLETVAGATPKLIGVRVNIYAGAAMLVFGAVLLLLVRRAAARAKVLHERRP